MAKRSFSDESADESEEEYSEHSDDEYEDNDVDSLMDNDEFQKEHDDEDVSVASSHRSEHDIFLGTQPDLSGKTKILMDSNESELKDSDRVDGHQKNQDMEKKEERSKKVSKLKLQAKSKDRNADSVRDKTKDKSTVEKKGIRSDKGLVYDVTVMEDDNDDDIGIPTVKNDHESSNVKSKASNVNDHRPTVPVSTSGVAKKKKTLDESTSDSTPAKKTKLDSSESSLHKSMPVPNTASSSNDNAPKQPKKKKLTFEKQVLSHLLTSLKPFTLKTLATEMKTTDTALHHLMLSLLDKQVVRRKEVGNKIKKEIYWIDIEKASKELYGTTMSNETERMQANVELKQCQQKEQELRKILTDFSSELSNEEVSIQIQRFDEEVTQLQTRVQEVKDRISNTSKGVPSHPRLLTAGMKQNPSKKPLTKNQLKKNINSMRLQWKSHKDKCVDFVENFADAAEKKPKDIYKLLEIETDEMVGVKIPPKQQLEE